MPGDIYYLEPTEVLGLYADLFGLTDQQSEDHLRSRPGLESALSSPLMWAQYHAADLALQAAVLAHGISETQAFADGNKRTALDAMLLFLALNGYGVSASQPERARWMIDLSRGAPPDDLVLELGGRVRASLIPSIREE